MYMKLKKKFQNSGNPLQPSRRDFLPGCKQFAGCLFDYFKSKIVPVSKQHVYKMWSTKGSATHS